MLAISGQLGLQPPASAVSTKNACPVMGLPAMRPATG